MKSCVDANLVNEIHCGKQWVTGAGFLTEVLQATVRNSKLGRKNTVRIKDVTMYDSELAKAVADMNAVSQGSWPDFGCVGSVWCGNAGYKEQASSFMSCFI